MGTSKQDLREWFKRGVKQKATHLIVACDTFSYEDFPVYVEQGQDVHEIAAQYNSGPDMLRVMEVYNLSMDMETQLAERRSFNY